MENPELDPALSKYIEKGYNRMGKELVPHERNDEYERCRIIARKWRNLVGEARFDIPTFLHRYVNWLMPSFWEECAHPYRISGHDFKIEIPGFAVVHVIYRNHGSEWFFHQFDILESPTPIASSRYHDLPLFLAIAKELKQPKKQKVIIEEIEGDLAENATLIKLTKEKSECKNTGYVLTMEDFVDPANMQRLNNPGADDDDFDFQRASDDGMRGG